jgi:ribosomal protein L11 methyltransferase
VVDSPAARWLEVSLTLEPELAEAVAEVLARFTTNGVVTEQYVVNGERIDPQALMRVYGYLPVDGSLEEKRRKLEEALWFLGRIQAIPQPVFTFIKDEDWMAAWKQHYHPIPIGKRLLILPAWLENPDPERIAVKIDPSMAFGTGTHPSTQLCLELIEKYVQPGQAMIDVGCGSGILSIAALHLGAIHALAVDIDPVAVSSSRENGASNAVLERLETGEGSVEEILKSSFSIKNAPLVAANILAGVIIDLLKNGLAELVSPGGTLVLAGVLETQANDVQTAAKAANIKFLESRQINDWVALVFTR